MSDVYVEPVSVRVTNPNLNVGILDAPDSYRKVLLFDDKKASNEVRQLNQDIYDVRRHPDPTKNRKIPRGAWFILASAVIAVSVLFFKHFVK